MTRRKGFGEGPGSRVARRPAVVRDTGRHADRRHLAIVEGAPLEHGIDPLADLRHHFITVPGGDPPKPVLRWAAQMRVELAAAGVDLDDEPTRRILAGFLEWIIHDPSSDDAKLGLAGYVVAFGHSTTRQGAAL